MEKKRPGIVHRLDKDTSGVILVAKNEKSHTWLQSQFKLRNVEKQYLALVDGHPPTKSGRILAPIYRDKHQRKRMAVAPEGQGKNAETRYHLLKQFKDHTYLEVLPLTGRTHQIRIHLASMGIPICGDRVYGYRKPSIEITRQFLHAAKITFCLPGDEASRTFSADLPEELQNILDRLI